MDDTVQEFVGRKDFLERLNQAWNTHRLVQVHGLRSVGKTRTMQQFLKDVHEHFRQGRANPNTSDDNSIHNLTGNSNDAENRSTAAAQELKVVVVDMRSVTTVSSLHSNICAQFGILPLQYKANSNDWIYQVVRTLNAKVHNQDIFVFDNAEEALDNNMKDDFLSLCHIVIKNCRRARIIITTTTNAQFVELNKTFFNIELPPMDLDDSRRLLKQVAPLVDFGEHLKNLVELCEGLPLALLMVGSMLTDDDGILTPAEIVELLVECRLEALSRDCYPQNERIGPVYRKFIQRLSEVFQTRLSILGYIPGSFNASEATVMLGHRSTAEVKQESLIPLRQRNMLQMVVVPERKSHRFDIHGILRDCLSVYFTIKNIKEIRTRFIRAFTEVMTRISEHYRALSGYG